MVGRSTICPLPENVQLDSPAPISIAAPGTGAPVLRDTTPETNPIPRAGGQPQIAVGVLHPMPIAAVARSCLG